MAKGFKCDICGELFEGVPFDSFEAELDSFYNWPSGGQSVDKKRIESIVRISSLHVVDHTDEAKTVGLDDFCEGCYAEILAGTVYEAGLNDRRNVRLSKRE